MAQSDSDHHAESVTTGELAELKEAVRVQGETLQELIDGVRTTCLLVVGQCDRLSQDR